MIILKIYALLFIFNHKPNQSKKTWRRNLNELFCKKVFFQYC